MKIIEKIRLHRKMKKDHKNAIAKAFSDGYMKGINDNIEKMNKLEKRAQEIMEISSENEKLLHKNYQESLDSIDTEWRQKCVICKQGLEAERKRLLGIRKEFLDAVQEFLYIHNKLVKYIAVVDTSHDMLLKNLSRLDTSQKYLDDIKHDADSFIIKRKDLLEKSV